MPLKKHWSRQEFECDATLKVSKIDRPLASYSPRYSKSGFRPVENLKSSTFVFCFSKKVKIGFLLEKCCQTCKELVIVCQFARFSKIKKWQNEWKKASIQNQNLSIFSTPISDLQKTNRKLARPLFGQYSVKKIIISILCPIRNFSLGFATDGQVWP